MKKQTAKTPTAKPEPSNAQLWQMLTTATKTLEARGEAVGRARFYDEEIKEGLLKAATDKPVRAVWQLDGFEEAIFDESEKPEVFWGITWELRNTTMPVRVHIQPTASLKEIVTLLRMITETVERDGAEMLAQVQYRAESIVQGKPGDDTPF